MMGATRRSAAARLYLPLRGSEPSGTVPLVTRRARDLLVAGGLSLVAFVLAHHLVYALAYGPNASAALTRTGHGLEWSATVLFVVLVAIGIGLAAAYRLLVLHRLVDRAASEPTALPLPGLGSLVGEAGRIWLRVFPTALAIYVINENGERATAGLPTPGLGVLATNGMLAFWVVTLVTLVIAMVAGLYRWRRDLLLARIRRLATRWPHPAAVLARRPHAQVRPRSVVLSAVSSRAPPAFTIA